MCWELGYGLMIPLWEMGGLELWRSGCRIIGEPEGAEERRGLRLPSLPWKLNLFSGSFRSGCRVVLLIATVFTDHCQDYNLMIVFLLIYMTLHELYIMINKLCYGFN